MCGVFGFMTQDGRGPSIGRLRRLATQTQRRGHHAFGLAWIAADGTLHTFKRPGAATANLGDLERCRDAIGVIGHCRWATHGSPEENRNNHPHPAGRGWVVHNGVVGNFDHLRRKYRLDTKTQCDSEVLGLLMARFPGPLGLRAAKTAAAAEGRLVILGLWTNPARLVVVRNGNPLSLGQAKHGFYFASLPEDLPGRVLSITDQYAGVLTSDPAGVQHDAYQVQIPQTSIW